jgi:RNA polymerase sigma-70 factor (ECF subfamily)
LAEGDAQQSPLVATYLEHRPMLVRMFAARLGSPAAAEDLVQEIYVRIATQVEEPPVSNLLGYLYRIGWNLMLDARRGARRTAAREATWADGHTTRVGAETVAEAAPPEAAIDARRRLAALMTALEELPPQIQRTFRLHKFDGLTHAQCAARLGISRSSVEKHVSAALKHLLKATRP